MFATFRLSLVLRLELIFCDSKLSYCGLIDKHVNHCADGSTEIHSTRTKCPLRSICDELCENLVFLLFLFFIVCLVFA